MIVRTPVRVSGAHQPSRNCRPFKERIVLKAMNVPAGTVTDSYETTVPRDAGRNLSTLRRLNCRHVRPGTADSKWPLLYAQRRIEAHGQAVGCSLFKQVPIARKQTGIADIRLEN